MKQCTFQPNAHKGSKSPKVNSVEVSKKLHVDANQRKLKKKNVEEEQKEKEKVPVQFTFTPIVGPVKHEVFETNPIKDDKDIKKRIERYERARIEKKLCELQKQKGVNNFKNVANIEEMIKKEEHTPWHFGIEAKTYKDTFEVRKVQEKKDMKTTKLKQTVNDQAKEIFINNETQNNVENNSNTFDHEPQEHLQETTNNVNTDNYNSNEVGQNQVNVESESNTNNNNSEMNTINPNKSTNNPLELAIDVNITENTSDKLEIYKNDNLDEVIDAFCAKNGLDDSKKTMLKEQIVTKLSENSS